MNSSTRPFSIFFPLKNNSKLHWYISSGIRSLGSNVNFICPSCPFSILYTQSSMNTVLEAMDIPCNRNELDMKFKAINTHYQSTFVLLMEKPEFKRLRLIDLEDNVSLKEIVSKYFDKIPIDLDRLNL